MANERLSMRHIREVLRLHYSVGMSQRTVARSLGLAQGTVSKYLNRTRRAGLSWPLPPELDDDVRLENRLYPQPPDLPSEQRPQPDWAVVHSELRRPGVTLMLLWEEYCDSTANAFSYSCYVTAKLMLWMPGPGQGFRRVPWLGPQHRKATVGFTRPSGMPSMMAENVAEVIPSSR